MKKTEKSPMDSPLMKQYASIKAKYPDAILLFRVGDFYETFGHDACLAADILGITLTSRGSGYAAEMELAGFPYHALGVYLPKLVKAGQRVAVCDQLEDPKLAKGVVKRGVTELVTPGVAIGDNVLETKENNFLAAVYMAHGAAGVAFLDISTGEFFAGEGKLDYVDRLLASFRPKEIVFEKGKRQAFVEAFGTKWLTYPLDDWAFVSETAIARLNRHFETLSLKGFGVHNLELATTAAGAVMHYLDITEHNDVAHVDRLARIDPEDYVGLDRFTIKNLELFGGLNSGATSLDRVLDCTTTAMGSRMLKRWIATPLRSLKDINNRLDTVQTFVSDPDCSDVATEAMKKIGDLERIVGKIATMRLSPRDVIQLKKALTAIVPLKNICQQKGDAFLQHLASQIDECADIRTRIEREIEADPSVNIAKGGVIASGVNAELDDLRNISANNKEYLSNMQARLIEETDIPSLKVAYNNVFGYYIEVRNTHKDKVPDNWIRKQTLTSAERYITEELKEYEQKILNAEERTLSIELQLFRELLQALQQRMAVIKTDAEVVATIDVLHSFAEIAKKQRYCRPKMSESSELQIVDGRHPVIETLLPEGEPYIPNSIHLDCDDEQIIIITGPNMAGKSALLRQTALIVLMAQIGSFVPAASANVGIVDKIFTRVGASDNLSMGESTFMVEMTESANILNNVTPKSLVLFDELGRGTSTYDGISLAWSIVEYLHEMPQARAKTLFATHYHELNEMESRHARIRNYNVSVKEYNGKVLFLRKLARGGSEHSFGIHVAKLAGMPRSVVERANEILATLEKSHQGGEMRLPIEQIAETEKPLQLSIFQLDDPVLSQVRKEIENLDINNLTPIEALNKLSEIRKCLGLK